MKNIENIKKVSFIFFALIGCVHILAFLFISNNLAMKFSEIAQKTLTIPFLTISLIYGISSLRLMIYPDNSEHKILDATLSGLAIMIIVATITLTIIY